MREISEQIYALAVELESEELVGAAERELDADDIAPVLEALWERGVDFGELLPGSEEPPGDEEAIGSVSLE